MRLGDLIKDGGLRLGLMQYWLEDGNCPDVGAMFDAAWAAIKADGALWRDEDGERILDLEEPHVVDEVLRAAVAASAELEVDKAQVESVTALQFDGGNDIYCDVLLEELSTRLGCEWYELDTGGETEAFAVQSLSDVAALPHLESLDLDGHGHRDGGHDLTPLRGHAKLSKLTIFKIANGEDVLVTLPGLKEVRYARALSDQLAAALRKRGIEIL